MGEAAPYACATPAMELSPPGPAVTKHTPGLPVSRP